MSACPCPPASSPTIAGFTAFLRGQAGISTSVLPDGSPYINVSFCVALELVNVQLAVASALIYQLAVYNLGTSNVINFAQDVPDAPVIPGSAPPAPYFENLRNKWNINGFVSGVVQSAADEGTSDSLVVPDFASQLSLADLQYLKDPFGRQYLAFAQRYGTIWGLS